MTPMIDIVFQLLIFFIMTFKIVAQEGDFNIKMPQASSAPKVDITPDSLTINVYLQAGKNGGLAGITLQDDEPIKNFEQLTSRVRALIGKDNPDEGSNSEVELSFDYDLRYEEVVRAITAVTGYLDSDGTPVKLIEKIQFAPPKKDQGP